MICYRTIGSLFRLIDVELEWWDSLLPSWVVLWESINAENLCKLCDVHDLEFLKLKIGVECSIMELTHESHRVSPGQVSLLAVINSQLHIDFWLSLGSHWIWDSLEVLVVISSLESINELLVLSGVVKSLRSIWVQVTEVIEVFLSKTLTLGIIHLWLVERVVDDLKSLPIRLSLKKLVHLGLSGVVTVLHNPPVILG